MFLNINVAYIRQKGTLVKGVFVENKPPLAINLSKCVNTLYVVTRPYCVGLDEACA